MFLLILKSSACLAVFMLFYKLFLEKESVHHFKRFYLLGALLVSIVIPFITFTEYIQVETVQTFMPFHSLEFTDAVVEKNMTWQDYIPTVLWSVYALGVVVFSIRFLKNLVQLIQKIKANPKFKNQNYIHVLLIDLIHPHTFFNYIFLNKSKYEHNCIPNEVLLHEQTHAKQKHAIDILFIEILHIVFWFSPLLYFIKKDIKLNHEFLADQAVLKQGVNTKNYQNILLAFSSNASHNQLANAINYSLIKKRFTVMKTKTSKKAFWLKGLLILPILAILIYSFSEKEIVEKEVASLESLAIQEQITQSEDLKSYNEKNKAYESLRLAKPHYIKRSDSEQKKIKNMFNEVYAQYRKLSDQDKQKTHQTILPAGYYSHSIDKKGNKIFYTPWELPKEYSKGNNLIIINTIKDLEKNISSVPTLSQINYIYGNFGYVRMKNEVLWFCVDESEQLRLFNKKGQWLDKNGNIISKSVSVQQQATPKEVAEYNKLAISISSQTEGQQIIKVKDIKRLKYLYKLMSAEQKRNAKPFPKIAPMPPPPTSNIQHKVVSKTYENASEALLNAKKEFEIKAKTYGKAIKLYKREGKGDLAKLLTLHSEAKKLHSNFSILAKKEKLITPPPFPPAPKPAKVDVGVVPPPPPPVMKDLIDNMDNQSEALQKAWKAFKTESDKYGNAMQNYFSKKEGTIKALKEQYKEVMKLYNAYHDIAKKEKTNTVPPPPPPMDPFSTYSSLAQRTKYIPVNRENNLQRLRVLYDKISDSKKNKVESPYSIGNYITKLNSLTAKQTKKVTELLNNINKKAKSEGRKFYSAAEYRKLEKLYSSLLKE